MKKLVVMASLFMAMMMVSGCGTLTRCMQIKAEQVTINLHMNDPESMSENAYPRTLNILSQDQMVEGGSDSIASGNATPISALSGDKALEAASTLGASALSPGVGPTVSAAKKLLSGTKTATPAPADCATGNCAPVATP